MNIQKELNQGNGFAIVDIENIKLFKKLRNLFIQKINIKNETKNINTVRKAMARMNKKEINKSMIELLNFNNLSEMIVMSCPKLVRNLCGRELFIQRRAHIIVNVPGKGQAKQWPHYEMISGLSPFSYIIWAPLHNLDEDSGIYDINQVKSSKIMNEEEKKGTSQWC